ncbi:alpha-1,3-mannosyltransferase CMT1 [Colletotrichum graminicola]|uniref:Alpha-1,3-mannosyltransferase CMT1 n=1 Tax=Colletotrichum graminicola (strain M1.001 / M2 / FGSC 10212) TaxID=645133 RepID=E3QBM1_COLGM|nr:alpha-1,3-mannosyltransferase CMT1 [Colletotrichum graminicola M1.001]EFQ28360.1 alpha-1,3-mannosyltransferase CMT1 [Colletotrichum graminicola M1.001]WDK20726.1 alpha-1,3-mannosyltransferase CMT1 [Colletotrichum graminicola]
MARRKLIVVAQAIAVCLLLVSLLVAYDLFSGRDYFDAAYKPFRNSKTTAEAHGGSPHDGADQTNTTVALPVVTPSQTPLPGSTRTPTPTPPPVPPPPGGGDDTASALPDGDPEHLKNAPKYIAAILDPDDKSMPRLDCPRPDTARYQYLKPSSALKRKPKYFIALNIRQKVELLPRLMGSIVEALRFLGPENCVLSVVEGNSRDGTYEVLHLLRPELERLGTEYHFSRSDLDPGAGDRIPKLAELRNMALAPLVADPARYAADAVVLFLNDVAACLEDILELAHQRLYLGADMTCAFDWTYVGQDPTFYDVWISRTIAGDSFFEIPPDGNWNSAWNIFWNEQTSRRRLASHKPLQVFSCWNGAVAITARPLLDRLVRFRAPGPGECFQGEPQLFCKDMWNAGFGKIAVVPSVNLEYSDEAGRKIKAAKGYTSQWVGDEDKDDDFKVDWKADPPEKVKCMASYDKQTWEPWNQGLE